MIHSSLLSAIPWLKHGFGTRLDTLSQDGMASLEQIHSAAVLVADHAGSMGQGDALVANLPGVMVSVRTADCFPILLADTRNRAVAAVHAGWRGTAAHIVTTALREMHERFGTTAADVHAAIGPGIGVCCYEVGIEVARQFGLEQAGRIDLGAANRGQLINAGVLDDHIEIIAGCTQCDAHRFHSFRRDREYAGRMISFAGIVRQV